MFLLPVHFSPWSDSIVNKIIIIAREMGERGSLLAARWLLAASMTFALLRGCRALTPPGCPVIKGEPTLPQRSTADHNDPSLAGSFFSTRTCRCMCARLHSFMATVHVLDAWTTGGCINLSLRSCMYAHLTIS